VKAGWEVRPLGEVCEILDRLRKPITKRDRQAGPYPYYGATGVLDHVEGYLFDEKLVLIGEDGAKWEAGANSAFSIDGKTWVNNHAHVIRPHRGEALDDWLIYYLNASDLMPYVSGMTVPKLNQGRLREIPIPLPPLEEQQRIVALVDEAFEGLARARAHAEANLQNARELFSDGLERAYLKLAAGAPSVDLEELCTPRGVTYGVIKLGERVPSGVPCLRTSNVRRLAFDLDGIKLIAPALSAEYHRTILEGGEVLVNVRGTLGGVATVPDDMIGWNISREVAMVVIDPKVAMPEFVSFFVATRTAQNWLTGMEKGAAYKGINLSDLRKLKVPLPTLPLQRQAVEVASVLQASATSVSEAYKSKLQDINDLRQSLLQKAFAGELI